MEVRSVYDAFMQLENIKQQQKMLKTQEDSLKAYLKDQLREGPKDGIFMVKTMRKNTSWAKVYADLYEWLDDAVRSVAEKVRDEYTQVSEIVSFKQEDDDADND